MASYFGLIAVLEAAAIAWMLHRKFGLTSKSGRFETIDGLRGYLAFLVFVGHAGVWYANIHTGIWSVPESRFYSYCGFGSVALFFMITGFLFSGKILSALDTGRPIDWLHLYVSRFLRLVPMYLVMLGFVLAIAAIVGGDLQAVCYGRAFLSWLLFTFAGAPDLFGLSHTNQIVAGATWSLPYEWLFYFTLPLFAALVQRKNPGLRVLAFVGLLIAASLTVWKPYIWHLACFLGGIASAWLVRVPTFRSFAAKRWVGMIVIGCIATAFVIEPNVFSKRALMFLSAAFALIACGNDLFGLLRAGFSKFLGEMAYSVYLMHGVVLFLAFHGQVGNPDHSIWLHWGLVYALTPILLVVCLFTFRKVEHPSMRLADSWSEKLRSVLIQLRIIPSNER